MQANHQNGTAFIITSEVAGGTGLQQGLQYMNMSQLNALYSAGWDLSSHTVTHLSLTTLTTIVKFENHRNIHEKIEPQINIDERRFAAEHPHLSAFICG